METTSSASAVIRDGPSAAAEREARLKALPAHLAEGLAQAARGEFVEYSLDGLIAELDREG